MMYIPSQKVVNILDKMSRETDIEKRKELDKELEKIVEEEGKPSLSIKAS